MILAETFTEYKLRVSGHVFQIASLTLHTQIKVYHHWKMVYE